MNIDIYFSDYFQVDPKVLDEYGALNISLVADLPLFIDPFLLFNSSNSTYKKLHADIIEYLAFLRSKSQKIGISDGLVQAWYTFPEVSETWLGYSRDGNRGSGLGKKFANALNNNLHKIFNNFGSEQITQGSHLEKLCLIERGVGKDHISDFTANLIKGFLLEYTQTFAKKYLASKMVKSFFVKKVNFNYKTQVWSRDRFVLPVLGNNYVLLTPKDILAKEEIWINNADLLAKFEEIPSTVTNEELRSSINNYFLSQLPKRATTQDRKNAALQTVLHFPELIDYYIRLKEDHGDEAVSISEAGVESVKNMFIENIKEIVAPLSRTPFYKVNGNTYDEAMDRIKFLKDVIENQDGYRIFYHDGVAVKREEDLQLMFKFVWYGTASDVNREVNNGRGPVDFKISKGNKDKTLVEFKLASNSKLRYNLEHQLKVYEKANNTRQSIEVIMFFSLEERIKMRKILEELKLENNKNIILIDASKDNKISASNVRSSDTN